MQNIQDLKDKIFFESRNIIDILGKTNNVDELISKHGLLDDLAEKIAFLKLLDRNLQKYSEGNTDYQQKENHNSESLVTEEEAIFNNEFNEIGSDPFENSDNNILVEEEEAIFNNQVNEIIESDFHENIVHLKEENQPEANENFVSDEISDHLELEEEAVFNNQLNEIDEEPENTNPVLNFVDEDRILENSQPESEDDFNEENFNEKETDEEKIFNDELNEFNRNEAHLKTETAHLSDIFATEQNEDEILIEETENEYVSLSGRQEAEIRTESSDVESVFSETEIDEELSGESAEMKAENPYRRKIVDIDQPSSESKPENLKSDESFENLEAYRQEKKIKLASIRGLKNIQTLFDDDPLERETPLEKVEIPVVKEDRGSLIKTNIPTDFMEAEKAKPEFKLDLNDRMAFTKMLFGGSQSELNEVVNNLNSFKNVEDAKEYLSDLYYSHKWEKVDEYAQRLWILVENKFL
ncbi:hypothetical protein ASG31_02785 [Chryseobacterium sp. Leaf404]|uniref:hypothetical protein n=1 Tax=unclassified Chryseobacterium TaxID=2593645 RepID=UPI0007009D0A|nr:MULTISPECIES: hypothetical protein [unclassified Chryseobacterium]KQT22283.1 hypothetical protein ASG31_02785 [Chryseobacterium sp. Leaf404]